MLAAQVFADEELERLRKCPEISRDDLVRFFTLTRSPRGIDVACRLIPDGAAAGREPWLTQFHAGHRDAWSQDHAFVVDQLDQ